MTRRDVLDRLKRPALWVCAVLCACAWWMTTLRGPPPVPLSGGNVLSVAVYKTPDGRYEFENPYGVHDSRPLTERAIGAMYLHEEPLFGPHMWQWSMLRFHGMWSDYRYHLLTQFQSGTDTLDSSDPKLVSQFGVWLARQPPIDRARVSTAEIAATAKLASIRQSGPIAATPPQWLWMTEPIRVWYPRQVLRNAGEVGWVVFLFGSVVCLILPTRRERARRKRARGVCPHCGYDLKFQFDKVCSECGKDPKPDA